MIAFIVAIYLAYLVLDWYVDAEKQEDESKIPWE